MQGKTISAQVAGDQIATFRKYYDFGSDVLNKEQEAAIAQPLKVVTKALMAGRLVFDDDCVTITQYRKNGDDLVYKEVSGRAKMEMAKQPEDNTYGRLYALMGSLCGLDLNAMAKLKGPDLKCMEMLGLLFIST